ncbi:MAG: sulfotransferase [Planctomycetales bacterium]|nr:sulfotransferase [Planctomycetales bacterium]
MFTASSSSKPALFSTARLAQASGIVKLLAWAAAVLLIAGLFQLGASLLGVDFWILDKSSGAGVLIAIALTLLLLMLSLETQPMAAYGIVAECGWRRRALRGLLMGAGAYGACVGIAMVCGVAEVSTESLTGLRIAKTALGMLSAVPIALTQQIIFAGYLVSLLRKDHSPALSVLVPAALFAATATVGRWGTESGALLMAGLVLLATLLGMLRLWTGSITLSSGVLAGCIMARKFLSKSRLVEFDPDALHAWLLAPHRDPRMGILPMAVLAGAILYVASRLLREGERQAVADQQSDAAFKRMVPFSNLLSFAPLDRWLVLLWQARFRVGLAYLPRLTVTLIASALNTIISLPERLLAPLLLRHDPPDPVFILGMPRSGTTHLHNLLSLDPRFRSPRNYEVFNPHGFLTGWTTTACLAPVLTWRRPMDSVQMTVTSSQEEEFALAAMGCQSPYWSFCLPREVSRHDAYWQPEGFTTRQQWQWVRNYKLFLRKITCLRRRRTPLLKNPANTGRVKMLRRHFPRAKYIHIVRHPHQVYRSNQRLASQGLVVFQLQDPHPVDNYATRCLENYRELMDSYYEDTKDLPRGTAAEVRYEDLVANPLAAVKNLYAQLNIEVTPEFQRRIDRYLESLKGYQRNQHARLSAEEQAEVDGAMAPYLRQWGYLEERRAAA